MALSPMMQQYFQIKQNYEDTILMFRLGDFYEMFFDDAKTASKELELVLTGRDCGEAERAPMCGVPFHSVENYLARLVAKGYKVAICEQVEDPAAAKGIVKREVIRTITPGTCDLEEVLVKERNNFLCAIYVEGENFGVTFAETIYDAKGNAYTQEAKNSPEALTNVSAKIKNDYAYSGVNSLYVGNNYRTLSTALNVEKNTNYTLSYYAFAPNGKIMSASGIVTTLNIGRTNGAITAGQPVDSAGNPVSSLYAAVADFNTQFTLAKSAKLTFDGENWQKVTLNFNSGNLEKLYFAIAPSGDASFYIDELCLTAEEEETENSVAVKFVNVKPSSVNSFT